MADVSALNQPEDLIDLPPGFRFHPTDEELITHYLSPKITKPNFTATAIGDVDLNKCEPWDLPSKAKMGEKEWYFFCYRDRKYPTGMRTNRATEAGYWKATGKDKEIFRGKGVLVGMKKTLVFYTGRAPKGEKTNWVMHEFRVEEKSPYMINLPRTAKVEWVVCRVFHKIDMGIKNSPIRELSADSANLPPLRDPSIFNSNDGGFVDFDFKGIPASSSAMPSYISNMEDLHNYNKIDLFFPNNYYNLPPSTGFYPAQISPPAPYFPVAATAGGDPGYLHHELSMLRRHCKAEQLSSQSMVSASQDTGLSTDKNIEISSKYDDLEDPTSAEPVIDLDNMWKY